MSSNRFEEILQLKDLEVKKTSSPKANGSKSLSLKQKKLILYVIKLESNTNTNGQQ